MSKAKALLAGEAVFATTFDLCFRKSDWVLDGYE